MGKIMRRIFWKLLKIEANGTDILSKKESKERIHVEIVS